MPHSGKFQGHAEHALELFVVDAELVLGKAGGDVGVGVRAYVGIDTQAHRSRPAHAGGYGAYHLELGGGLHIEASYAAFEGEPYLRVALSDPGEEYASRREPGGKRSPYLASAHAVGTQAPAGYLAEYHRIEVGLHGIVHPVFGIPGGLCLHLVEGARQHGKVVIIERSLPTEEALQRKLTLKHLRTDLC